MAIVEKSAYVPQDVLAFWFEEIAPSAWWTASDVFDRELQRRFGALHAAAQRCELFAWRDSAAGRLAEIIVLDQFSRNIFRGKPGAFANDPLALALAQHALGLAADAEVEGARRIFFYMPFMHSESRLIHTLAAALFAAPGVQDNLAFELRHKAIIDRFGRYPHRNAILGRESTPEEVEFLKTPGSSF